jgi:nitrogen fixation protein FixH
MFDDLTASDTYPNGVPLAGRPTVEAGAVTLTFTDTAANPLPPETVTAIRARMTSRDDDDQTARANIAALRDAVTGTCPASLLLVALADYLLGETT